MSVTNDDDTTITAATDKQETSKMFKITKFEDIYYCECNRKFKYKHTLHYHLKHECGRCHKCKYCKLIYKSVVARNFHMRRHHKRKPQPQTTTIRLKKDVAK